MMGANIEYKVKHLKFGHFMFKDCQIFVDLPFLASAAKTKKTTTKRITTERISILKKEKK